MKKWLTLALGPILSVFIIYLLVGEDFSAVKDELGRARYVYLIPTTLLLILSLATRAVRWQVLLNQRASLSSCFHIMNIGYFLSAILPFRLGDFARAYIMTRLELPVPAFVAISTIVLERLFDLLALLAMLGLMLVLLDVPSEVTTVGAIIGLGAIIGGLALALIAYRPVLAFGVLRWVLKIVPLLNKFNLEARLSHFIEGIRPIGGARVAMLALFWSALSWFLSVAAGYALLFFLFDTPTLAAAVSLIVLVTMSVALPAVPGNLGPFEGAVVGGLWIGNMITSASPPANAPAVATGVVLHAVTLGTYVCFGVLGLLVQHLSVRQITTQTREFVQEHQMVQESV